ncbi:isochorismatase family cysteine hydrolase [Streptomyces sp. NPDC046261]|uniref:cysteine hydrolase family protein n=1 Tax=Streptomyces sp. NPDC046261 TaxID=3157200 RepID=UPI003404F51A
MERRPALLVMDLINEIVHPDGKYAQDGYLEQVTRRGVLERAAEAIALARAKDIPVIYVVVGFSPDFAEWPEESPVFREAREERRIVLGTWATQVHDSLAPADGEPVVAKHRLSPFHGTELDRLLLERDVNTLLLTGVTTDLVVLSTARDGHDRDYYVEVLEDATATADDELHEAALKVLARTADITTVRQALAG